MRPDRCSSQLWSPFGGPSRASGQLVARLAALLVACAAAFGYSGSSELNAQAVRLRPHARLNLPTRISIQNGILQVRQKIGVTVGAQLTVAFNERFDVVTAVTYAPGYAVIRGSGNRLDVGTGSQALSVSTGPRYWLIPPGRALWWEVYTRFAAVFDGRPAYDDLFRSSTLSGVLGTTVGYQIGQIVSLKIKVQERLYRLQFGRHDPATSRSPLRISFALGLPFLESAL